MEDQRSSSIAEQDIPRAFVSGDPLRLILPAASNIAASQQLLYRKSEVHSSALNLGDANGTLFLNNFFLEKQEKREQRRGGIVFSGQE